MNHNFKKIIFKAKYPLQKSIFMTILNKDKTQLSTCMILSHSPHPNLSPQPNKALFMRTGTGPQVILPI